MEKLQQCVIDPVFPTSVSSSFAVYFALLWHSGETSPELTQDVFLGFEKGGGQTSCGPDSGISNFFQPQNLALNSNIYRYIYWAPALAFL